MLSRLSRSKALLLVCDIQENFVPKTYCHEGALEAATMMAQSAEILGIPTLITEHTKKVFGETHPQIK